MAKILKFEQDSCAPCKKLGLFLEHELGVKPDETVNISSGTEDVIELAIQFGVMSTPVLVLVNAGGKEVKRIAGFEGKQEEITELFHMRG